MTLLAYKHKKRGNLTHLAQRIGVTLSSVSSWAIGIRKVPLIRALAIARATKGLVSVKTLRPDVDWKHT